jgi:molybdenum cofactor synthesis domain-containing protein
VIPPAEAWQRIAAQIEPLGSEKVDRQEALGRVLIEPQIATLDVPAADVSAMDGFALRGDVSPGKSLPVAGTIAAGDPPGFELSAGEAARIMTGAPVPASADRVVPVEQTKGAGEEMTLLAEIKAGAHIRRQGEIVQQGQPLLPAGSLLTPGALGLLATHGYSQVQVRRRPPVAVLATGDEVVPPDQVPGPGQLRDSHTDFLLAAGRVLALEFTSLGIAPDKYEALRDRVRDGLATDVLLITGGVSMGEFDFAEEVLEELGCEILFDSVALQPGKPLVAARHPGGWVFGLPGNPTSVMVCFWLFVRPLLRCLQGLDDGYWHGALTGELAAPLPGAKSRDRFRTAEVRFADGKILVTPIDAKGSHDLAAFACGTALVRVPAGATPAGPGDPCEILPLADWRQSTREG